VDAKDQIIARQAEQIIDLLARIRKLEARSKGRPKKADEKYIELVNQYERFVADQPPEISKAIVGARFLRIRRGDIAKLELQISGYQALVNALSRGRRLRQGREAYLQAAFKFALGLSPHRVHF